MKSSGLIWVASLLALQVCLLPAMAAEPPAAKILNVQKIWDKAPHNAFTDLIRHNGKWYCVFREGKGHVSPDGALRVITSTDGKEWTSAALVTSPDADLRDAKISIAPDGSLCLCGAGAWHQPKAETHQSFLWYSKDGKDWGEAIPVGAPGYWVWRVIWQNGTAYGLGYNTAKNSKGTRLYQSKDGRNFTTLVPELTEKGTGYVNEAGMLIEKDGTFLTVIRRDNKEDSDALLGTSTSPYTEWSWKKLGVRVGGPDMLQLPDGRIVVCGRLYEKGARTALWWLDPTAGKLTELAVLPSGGDTSYPGLVLEDGKLWISYYSSHEGKTSIYLAQVQLP